jgi:hypothetical protein
MRPLRIDRERRTELAAKTERTPAEHSELASLISRGDGYGVKLSAGINLDVPDEVGQHPLIAKYVVNDRVATALANARRAEEDARTALAEAEKAAKPQAEPVAAEPSPLDEESAVTDTARRVPRYRGRTEDAA